MKLNGLAGGLGSGRKSRFSADENGLQRPDTASSMGFGREGAICEWHDIMQIPPRFERQSLAYHALNCVWQYTMTNPML